MPDTGNPLREADRPYPLLRYFLILILPLLLGAVVGGMFFFHSAIATSIEEHQAFRNARIARLLVADHTLQPGSEARRRQSERTLADDLVELDLKCGTFLNEEGSVLLSASVGNDCYPITLEQFSEVRRSGRPELKEYPSPEGRWVTLAMIRAPGASAPVFAGIEERSDVQEASIHLIATPFFLIFAAALASVVSLGGILIWRAQQEIDNRAAQVLRKRDRLGSLLSRRARDTVLNDAPAAELVQAVIMFADLRNFSGYAEVEKLDRTVDLVSRFITAAGDAITSEGGDIDKFVGDGVLAWFDGPDAEAAATRAAIKCIDACVTLPRRPGVGLHAGPVIATALGHGDRREFTILGGTVNIAARLCSLAAENQIVASVGTLRLSATHFTLIETMEVAVRNHRQPVRYERWQRGERPEYSGEQGPEKG